MKLSVHIEPHQIVEKVSYLAQEFFKAFEENSPVISQKIERDFSYDEKEDGATMGRTIIFETIFSTSSARMNIQSSIVQNVSGGKVWEARCKIEFKGKIEITLEGKAGNSVLHDDRDEQRYVSFEWSVVPLEAEKDTEPKLKNIFDSLK